MSEARRHALENEPHAEGDWHRPWLGGAVCAAVLAVLLVAVVRLPDARAALPAIARHAMTIAVPQWGTTEGVNEIVYGTRGFDTFGETFLLLGAVVAVLILTRTPEHRDEYVGESSAGRREQGQDDPPPGSDRDENQANEAEEAETSDDEPLPDPDDIPLGTDGPEVVEAMTVFVRMSARVVSVLLAVAGVYLAAWGYTPGGGFPAGAALVGVAVFLYAALGFEAVRPVMRPKVLEPVELVGALAVIAVGVVGIAMKNSMFANWLPLAQQQTIRGGGTLQVFSGAELIEVATGLSIAIFALLGMKHDWTPDPHSESADSDSDSDSSGSSGSAQGSDEK